MSTEDDGPLSRAHGYSEDGEPKEVIYGRVEDFVLPACDPAFEFAGPRIVNLLKAVPQRSLQRGRPRLVRTCPRQRRAGRRVPLVETSFLTPERKRNKYAVRFVSIELPS